MKLAVVGKGGSGKTTTSSVIARTLARSGKAVVALDCDSNPNLGISLGVGDEETERLVRRALAIASEFAGGVWPAGVELSDDPVAAAWQLAAIAPLGALDQVELLEASTMERLLTRIGELTTEAAVAYEAPWPPDDPSEG